MADEFDLGLAILQEKPTPINTAIQRDEGPQSAPAVDKGAFRPNPAFTRVPSTSGQGSLTKPKTNHHVKRRSSLGDSIGLQHQKDSRAQLVPATPLPDRILDQFRETALCFAVVNFDIDQGPDLVACYPAYDFTRDEQNSIAFTSLPDSPTASTSSSDHNQAGPSFATYSWKIARDPLNRSTRAAPEGQNALYGYVNFMTQQDKSLKRSYLQRSVVLVTQHAHLHGLFGRVAELLSSVNAQPPDKMSLMIEVACNSIARWPSLSPGFIVELPFLDSLITAEVPLPSGSQYPPVGPAMAGRPMEMVLAGNPLLPLSFVFANHLSSLWSLWELVALSEPIIVYGTDVPLVSAAVAWLTLLSKPITFAGDYRSSLNIHMHDYHRFVNANPPQKALFIGTTNPLVFSSCRHWPHFLRISPKSTSSTNSTSQHNSNHFKPHSSGSVFGLPNPTLKEAKGTSSFKAATESNNGLFSHHRRTIKKDHAVLKSAEESVKTGDYRSADATLLRHFFDLSEKLLSPLNRFFSSLQPLNENPLATLGPAPMFNTDEFTRQLMESQIPLGFKRNKLASKASPALHFYQKWLRTPAFAVWLRKRVDASHEASRSRFLGELATMNVDHFSETQSSTRIVDLLKKLDEAAERQEGESDQAGGDRAAKLRLQALRLRELQDASSEASSDSSHG